MLAIERCLLQQLPTIFTPEMVFDFINEQVRCLAGESEESLVERAALNDKLKVLEGAVAELEQLKRFHVTGTVNRQVRFNADDEVPCEIAFTNHIEAA